MNFSTKIILILLGIIVLYSTIVIYLAYQNGDLEGQKYVDCNFNFNNITFNSTLLEFEKRFNQINDMEIFPNETI
jgi:hypothetical protein